MPPPHCCVGRVANGLSCFVVCTHVVGERTGRPLEFFKGVFSYIPISVVTAKRGSTIWEQGLTQDSRINGLATKSEKWNGNSAD